MVYDLISVYSIKLLLTFYNKYSNTLIATLATIITNSNYSAPTEVLSKASGLIQITGMFYLAIEFLLQING